MVLYEGIAPCRCGGIGRRTGLKIPRRKSYGFDPRHRYHVRRSKHRSVSALRRKLHYVSSFFLSKSNPLRWALIWFFLFSKSTDFGIGSRSTQPRSGDGGVSRLVPVGDLSPRITNIPHDANVTGDAAFYSTSTTPSSLTVTVMPVLTYSRNSSPSWSTTGIFASVQTSASIAPDAARESIGMLKSMHAG